MAITYIVLGVSIDIPDKQLEETVYSLTFSNMINAYFIISPFFSLNVLEVSEYIFFPLLDISI